MFIYEQDSRGKGTSVQQHPRTWHAITVLATETSCQAAKACVGRRFLTSEVPRLPMPGCTQAHCDCRYRHFDDRRVKPRRSGELGGLAKRVVLERRVVQSRRQAPP